jgi:hypothetical protein
MSSSSFARMAVVTASTKRSPVVSGGKRGTPTTQEASFACTPLDPIDPEVRQRLMLDSPNVILETFVENSDGSLDIVVGDILVVGSTEYPIKAVEDWYWRTETYRHLFVEKLKP